jgi:hypothetical protein
MTDARRDLDSIQVEYLFDMVADLEERLDMGRGPIGRRVYDRVRRGTFAGPRLRGEVVAGGGDWALFRSDGVVAIDARVALRTDDDALIHMTYGGRVVIPDDVRPRMADPTVRHTVDPGDYYFRTNPVFETGSEKYGWLNGIVAVGHGYLIENGGVAYRVAALA